MTVKGASMTGAGTGAPACKFAISRDFLLAVSRRGPRGGRITDSVQQVSRPTMGPTAGELLLGRYRPVRRIGAGGMGVVWLAHDEKLNRPVAVKRIPVHDEAVAKRAAREARAAARLAHPAIVALHEAGRDEDAVYLVSELVVGSTLAELMAQGALSDRDVLSIGAALCDALAHAHGRGVIHRDVKPQNIIVPDTQQSGTGVAKLTDFGIAMLTDEDVLTRTGDVVGTLAYMAPEQAEGGEVTAQADVYALALVLYEALSGSNPVRGRTPAATARRVGERLPKLERLRRDLPRELCAAVDRAVDPDPRARGKVTALRTVLRTHGRLVHDEPGTVDGGPLEAVTRVGRRAARRVAPRPGRGDGFWPATDEGRAHHDAPPVQEQDRGRRVTPLSARGLGALGAGALTAAALSELAVGDTQVPVTAPAGALVVVVVVAVLPRLGALLLVLALAAWLLAAQPGTALLVLAAGLPAVLALWRARPAWFSAPALAPLLGLASLALAWPAVAGQARRATHRAILGALGCWWLLLVQAMTQHTLLVGPVPGVGDPLRWTGSAPEAFRMVLAPLITSGALGLALVWSLAAAVLPVLVRGRSAPVDIVMATAWAAGLAAATQVVARALPWPGGPPPVHGVVVPGILAGVIAVVACASRGAVSGRS